MPYIQKLNEELAAKGLTILGLNVGEEAATVEKFANQQAYTFQMLLDAEPQVQPLLSAISSHDFRNRPRGPHRIP